MAQLGAFGDAAQRRVQLLSLLAVERTDAVAGPLYLLYAVGRVPHEQRMATIEVYGREVIPRVRELLAARAAEPAVRVGR